MANKDEFYSKELGIYMRSTWEVKIATILDRLGIEFEYEPKRFLFARERQTYLPDFYLPEYNVWIEVKGWYDHRSQNRQRLFYKYYPKEKLIMIKEYEYKKILEDHTFLLLLLEMALLNDILDT